MSSYDVRKTRYFTERVRHDRGPLLEKELVVVTGMAVVANPFAGRYEPDLMPFMAALRDLGSELTHEVVKLMGGADKVEAYGKGMMVGEDGEIEHAAVWHEAGGWAMREVLGGPKAIVPALKSMGGPGARLMIPLGHIHASFVRGHHFVTEMSIWDAPRRDELLFGLAMASGARPNSRLAGLTPGKISVHDGQK
jgi:hypothetical protein